MARRRQRAKSGTLVSHTFGMPKGVINLLRKEAIRRLEEGGLLEEQGWKPMARDIMCVCIMLSYPSIKDMSLEEFNKLVTKVFDTN